MTISASTGGWRRSWVPSAAVLPALAADLNSPGPLVRTRGGGRAIPGCPHPVGRRRGTAYTGAARATGDSPASLDRHRRARCAGGSAELTGSSAPLGDTVEGKSLLGPEHKSVADASETRTTSTVAVFASRSGMSVGAPFSHAGETDEPYSGALQPAAQNPDMRHPTHEAVDSGCG